VADHPAETPHPGPYRQALEACHLQWSGLGSACIVVALAMRHPGPACYPVSGSYQIRWRVVFCLRRKDLEMTA
jgi:hypothetical protein